MGRLSDAVKAETQMHLSLRADSRSTRESET